MKKLIIAAAIVCVAAMSQAASFKWTASGVTGYDTTDLYSGDVTIHLALATGGDWTTYETTMTDGAFSLTESGDWTAGKAYQAYYTMTDSDGNVYTSDTKKTAAHATSTREFKFAATGEWVAAPEPTSGLLLLLGVAGLALKRKQK